MRKTAIGYVLTATITLLLITGITTAQEIGTIFDPEPNIDGHFMYTIDDWKFVGDILNERVHVQKAIYGGGAPDDLGIHLETEYGMNTQSN